MRRFLSAVLLVGLFHNSFQDSSYQDDSDSAKVCNEADLVACFTQFLDELSWSLYISRSNIIRTNEKSCKSLQGLNECLEKADERYGCSHAQMVEATQAVTQILAQRTHSGNFLRSYYVMSYACSDEAREIVNAYGDCLDNQQFGSMIMNAGTYLAEKFGNDEQDYCEEFEEMLKDYVRSLKGTCPENGREGPPQLLFCKSVATMLKSMRSAENPCTVDCERIVRDVYGDSLDGNVAPTMDLSRGEENDMDAQQHTGDEPGAGELCWNYARFGGTLLLCLLALIMRI